MEIKASDCKCVECGQQAVVFWPCIDPDIPSHPYCRKCLDRIKFKMVNELLMNDCKSESAKLQKKKSSPRKKRSKPKHNTDPSCK